MGAGIAPPSIHFADQHAGGIAAVSSVGQADAILVLIHNNVLVITGQHISAFPVVTVARFSLLLTYTYICYLYFGWINFRAHLALHGHRRCSHRINISNAASGATAGRDTSLTYRQDLKRLE